MSNSHHEIRSVEPADIPEVVRIHRLAFPSFFMTQLGEEFLRRYYTVIREYDESIFRVTEGEGIGGFAAGFVDPPAFYRLLSERKRRFFVPLALRVAVHPSLAGPILRGMGRVSSAEQGGKAGRRPGEELEATHTAELASLAVDPRKQKRGLGKALVQSFVEEARARGARRIIVKTDAEDNDAVNRFYERLGFRIIETYRDGERRMNRLALD